MKRSNLDLLRVLEESPLATAIYDNPGLRIAFANEAMLKMWCAAPSILGRQFGEVFPSFKKEGFASILENVWHSGITYRATDTPAIIVDGHEKNTRYFDFEYKALLDDSGQTYAILHSATDVTQRKLNEGQLQSQQEQLSFNSELETLTYTLSHDVKNPLCVAQMGLAYLQDHEDITLSDRTQWYHAISQALANVESIINQTVQLSEARSIANIPKINDLTQKIPAWCEEARLLHHSPNSTINLGELFPVYGDIGAIYQIFINIIGNAVKYSSSIVDAKIEIYSEKTDKGTVYFVRDNGIGIPEPELDKIFCISKRGSNALEYQGNGIGLCLAKRIIERYAGRINVSSKEGRGTLVRLFFPDKSSSSSTKPNLRS